MRHSRARLLIFARAPIPGEAKTRLIPALGAEGAARLQQRMTERLVSTMSASRLCPLELWVTPNTDHPLFRAIRQRYDVPLHAQRGRDLGERMYNAFEHALARSDRVVLIGSDCPTLTPDSIAWTLDALEHVDAVIGPAEDGGYVLIATKRLGPTLFSEMPWGGDRVADVTRQRMRILGWTRSELPMSWDVDRPEDLLRAKERYPELLGAEQST